MITIYRLDVGLTFTEVMANTPHYVWNGFCLPPTRPWQRWRRRILNSPYTSFVLLTGWLPRWSRNITETTQLYSTCRHSINFQIDRLPCSSNLVNLLFQPSQTLVVCGWLSEVIWCIVPLLWWEEWYLEFF